MTWLNIGISICATVVALLAFFGEKFHKERSGLNRIKPLGWIALVFVISGFSMGVWRERLANQSSIEQARISESRAKDISEIKTAVNSLIGTRDSEIIDPAIEAVRERQPDIANALSEINKRLGPNAVVETPFRLDAEKLDCLANEGIRYVARYYNFTNSSVLPDKRLDSSEIELAREYDIGIIVVFQQSQIRVSDFGFDNGVRSGERALSIAAELGQPAQSAIYFAVDFDANPTDLEAVLKFFEGVREAQDTAAGTLEQTYWIGAYGSGTVLSELKRRGLIAHSWLSAALGWSGSREFLESGQWNLLQTSNRSDCVDGSLNMLNIGAF